MEGQKVDNVNHPAHYEASTSIECIEAMMVTFGERAVCHFCVCNAFKYIWRHKNKGGLEDIEKAQWYIDKAFEINEMYDTLSCGEQEALLRLAELKKQKEQSWQESH